jgi:YD repeat-containing protein
MRTISFKKIFFSALLFAGMHEIKAQTQSETGGQFTAPVLPMMPNAAALAKFVDIPVSYYTGTPQISVPLYEIKTPSLTVPVSLNYHASGIKVDEIASSVGLGWVLSAGGVISRQVRGAQADEAPNGFFAVGYQIETPDKNCDNSNLKTCDYLRNTGFENIIDSEPDLFFLSLPNGGGVKFIYDYNGNIVFKEYAQLLITKDAQMRNWSVVTPDGVQYLFGVDDSYGARDVTVYTPEGAGYRGYNTSWHLSKIISADKIDTIYFEYATAEDIVTDSPLQEAYYQRDLDYIAANPDLAACPTFVPVQHLSGSTSVTQTLLSKIKFPQGSVEFRQSDSFRKDLTQSHAYKRIDIKRNDGSLLKYFVLDYGYFDKTDRLKLTGVTEFSSTGVSQPPHLFFYDESRPLPERGSFAQDHWGYYNGKANKTFIPKRIEKPDGTFIVYSAGADREADPNFTKSSTLTKIVYPTGGYDVIEYEVHAYGKTEKLIATETYTEPHSYLAHALTAKKDVDVSASIVITETTPALITGAASCHGNCGTTGACEKGQAGATFFGPANSGSSVAWSCLGNPAPLNTVLTPGTYYVEVFGDYLGKNVFGNASLKIELYKTRKVTFEKTPIVGGVRVKKISRYADAISAPKITRFKYEATISGQTLSSGVVVRKPSYYTKFTTFLPDEDNKYVTKPICFYDAGHMTNHNSLGEGTHIGYSLVTVLHGESGEYGKETFSYTSASDFPDGAAANDFPFPPSDSNDDQRGLLLQHAVYDNSNNLVSRTTNEYAHRPEFTLRAMGLKVGMPMPAKNIFVLSAYRYQYYYFRQHWQYLSSTTERVYSTSHDGTYTETVTDNFYDRPRNHILLTRQEKSQSDGSFVTSLFKYPQDYLNGGNGLANINSLVSAHIFTTPIEEQHWKLVNGVPKMISGKITDYEPQFFKPSEIWSFDSDVPATSLDNETMSGNLYSNLLSDNSRYKLRAQFDYQKGRIIKQSKTLDDLHSYIWGYNNTYPVAKAVNADQSEIAFTSFEDGTNSGGWTYSDNTVASDSKTGQDCHNLDGSSITRSGLSPTTTYTLSYWAKGGIPLVSASGQTDHDADVAEADGWRYFEKSISGVASITLSGEANMLIDELRIYPKDARMTTYTYQPLVGICSATDANNRITYYEYDTRGRLIITRDHNKNIIKKYDYHYAFTSSANGN